MNRICTQSPKKRQNKINFKEIIEQLKHLHRKKQNAMITKEIIDWKTSSTPEKKAKHNEYQRNYSASNISIELLIKKIP